MQRTSSLYPNYYNSKQVGFSILIVTKNRAILLERCLNSLRQESLGKIEIVIIDNKSTDKTPQVIKKHQHTMPIFTFKTSLTGYPKLYNFGIKKCRGKYIIFLDDDCWVESEWFSRIVESIKLHPKETIQGCIISEPKDNIYAEITADHYRNWIKSHLISDSCMDTFDNKNLVIRRKLFFQKGVFVGFNEELTTGSEDIELGYRLSRTGIKIIYDPEIVAHHQERTDFKSFFNQHLRIAQSEKKARQIVISEKLNLIPKTRFMLNFISFINRELHYLLHFNIFKAFQTLWLYIILVIVRIYGYNFK